MTNDTIDRAIKRGTGEVDGGTYEAITYEGYAPGGVALLIDVLTDNRNRTGAEVRNIFTKLGGSMAEPGAVGWQFSRTRRRPASPGASTRTTLMLAALDAGADDVADDGDSWRVTSRADRRRTTCATALEAAGHRGRVGRDARWCRQPSSPVTDARRRHARCCGSSTRSRTTTTCRTCTRNFDIPDELMEAVERMSVGVGDAAPAFTLPGTGGSDVLAVRLRRHSRSCSSSTRATTRRCAPSS